MANHGNPAESENAARAVFSSIWPGALAAQAIHCAARLRIADRLAAGPRTAVDLAGACGAEPVALSRLLRALASLDLVREAPPGTFASTEAGAALREDHPSGVHAWALMLGAPYVWRPWGDLLESVRTGEPAFRRVFGCDFYEYVARHPEHGREFDDAMDRGSAERVREAIRAIDFSRFETIVDVGGGRGALLLGILRAFPGPRGVLLDRPRVVETAHAPRDPGVADRFSVLAGDFFDGVPEGDAYILKGIVHGLADPDATRVLGNIREAIRPGGRVFVFDVVLSETNEPDPRKAMMDLMMLALVEGRERTAAQLDLLLSGAGFRVRRLIETDSGNTIVEAEPA